jgi:hypothetical protein
VSARSRYWRCRRQVGGVVCGQLNLTTKRKCTACGKLRPKKRQPAHRAGLASFDYEAWVARFGEECMICGAGRPASGRRLHRDHEHSGDGLPRGILCHRCNTALRPYMDPAWLRRALTYMLDASERRRIVAGERCDRVLIGEGGDAWDPVCSLRLGHEPPCRP